MTYEKMLAESKRLDEKIKSIQTQLGAFPDGKLVCTQNGTHTKWFLSDGHKSTYLPKKERPLAEQMAHKKFLSLQLQHLIQEQTAIGYYLRHHDQNSIQTEQSFLMSPKYQELLAPTFVPLSQELQEWANAPYERNTLYPENLVHQTCSGIYVRSKSEMLIDMVLFQKKIPFRYECLLELDDGYCFPDFTILHPRTKEIIYWEHFGMMDNEAYRKHASIKLQRYISNGIIPTIHLITTYETKEHPLDLRTIEELVAHYFL